MSIEGLGATVKVDCEGPDCFVAEAHVHQHWVWWPDEAWQP